MIQSYLAWFNQVYFSPFNSSTEFKFKFDLYNE